jgi:hypothetical protein
MELTENDNYHFFATNGKTANFLLFATNGIGNRMIVFLGRQTIIDDCCLSNVPIYDNIYVWC